MPQACAHRAALIKCAQVACSWIRLTWILFQNSHCPEVSFQAEKLEDKVLSSFPVWKYWSCVSYLISISPAWQKKTKLGEEFITKVFWILLHLREDTHTHLVAYEEPRGPPGTRYLSHFPDITSLSWAGVYSQWHTFSHPVSYPLGQNNMVFHFYIHNYPERQRGKISLSIDKLLGEHLDRLRKITQIRIGLKELR